MNRSLESKPYTRAHRQFLGMAIMLTWLLLASCATHELAATEVENEFQVAQIEGVAATGAAIAHQSIQLMNLQGNILAEARTDSMGRFQFTKSVALADSILLLRILSPYGDSLASLVFIQDDAKRTAHVNPLTQLVVESLLQGDAVGIESDAFASKGQEILRSLLGGEVPWSAFSSDSNFVAWTPSESHKPALADVLLHTLMDEVRWQGITLAKLSTQVRNTGRPLLHDSVFQQKWLARTIYMKVDTSELERQLPLWSRGVPNADQLLEQQRRQRPEAHGRIPANPQNLIMRVIQRQIQSTPLPAEYRAHKTVLADILREVVWQSIEVMTQEWDQQIDANIQPLVEEIVATGMAVLTSFAPEEFLQNPLSIQNSLTQVVVEQVLSQINLEDLRSDESGSYFLENYKPIDKDELKNTIRGGQGVPTPALPLNPGNDGGP
jgi:hypothetical protein